MSAQKLMLIACGSFNPPTPMHLRMFEIARDYFAENGTHQVIGGIISPVHDAYGKNGLASAKHRCAMVKLVLKSSNWIRLSDWECNYQEKWTPTRQSLQYHQNYVNSYMNDINGTVNQMLPGWMPDNIKQLKGYVQLKLICGGDLLESFAVPGLWAEEDIEAILGQHGVVVITRSGSNPEKFIFESDLLSKYKKNITIVTNWVANEVSSTAIRRFLRRGLSVKYLIDDNIIEYIKRHGLYNAITKEKTKYILTPNENDIELSLTEPDDYLNDNDVDQLNLSNYNSTDMDLTDFSTINQEGEEDQESPDEQNDSGTFDPDELPIRPKIFCCGGGEKRHVKSANSRPNETVNVLTHQSRLHSLSTDDNRDNDRDNDYIHEVGECSISTLTLTSNKHRALEKKIEFLSDNHLNRIGVGDDGSSTFDTTDDVAMPTTSARSQNDLIKFVFTSHGIRVISDKEYVV